MKLLEIDKFSIIYIAVRTLHVKTVHRGRGRITSKTTVILTIKILSQLAELFNSA